MYIHNIYIYTTYIYILCNYVYNEHERTTYRIWVCLKMGDSPPIAVDRVGSRIMNHGSLGALVSNKP